MHDAGLEALALQPLGEHFRRAPLAESTNLHRICRLLCGRRQAG
jgi:hypothetical protein